MNITDEQIKQGISAIFSLLTVGMLALVSGATMIFLDVRSLKKGNKALFIKVRELEAKVFGKVTSILDEKGRDHERGS